MYFVLRTIAVCMLACIVFSIAIQADANNSTASISTTFSPFPFFTKNNSMGKTGLLQVTTNSHHIMNNHIRQVLFGLLQLI